MATPAKPFDPNQYGATPVAAGGASTATPEPVNSFDPDKYGATPVALPSASGFRKWVDEQLAPGPENTFWDRTKEAVKGGASGLIQPLLHPVETLKGMGAGTVGSGMSSSGYPIFAPTGNQERDLQNIQTQESTLREQAEAGKDAMQNHPVHTISSVVVPGVVLHKAGEAVNALKEGGVGSPVGKLRESVQNSFGAGPRLTEKLTDAATENFVKDKATANTKRIAAFDANQDQFARAKSQQMQDAAKLQEKTAAVEQHNSQHQQLETKRLAAEKASDTKAAGVGKGVEKLESDVGREADKRFNNVREKIGNPEAPSDDLVNSVKGVETGILQGIPENVKEFRSILGLSGENEQVISARADAMKGLGFSGDYENLSNEPAGPPQRLPNGEIRQLPSQRQMVDDAVSRQMGSGISENKPVTWDYLQSLKSRIDARLRGAAARTMNGDLKRGLYAVRDSVVGEMGKMAEAAGAGEDWAGARDFYRQYKEDFATPNGPSGSGSPVAQALDAVDPKNIRQSFLRTQSSIGNRGLDILRKYQQFGGEDVAKLVEDMIGSHNEKIGTKVGTPKELPVGKQLPPTGELKAIPPEAEAQPVDIEGARYDKIRDKINDWRQMSKWEARTLGLTAIPERVMSWAFDRPGFVEWATKPTPADIRFFNKLPPEVKAATVKAFKNIADLNAKQTGQPSQLSPEFARMLKVTGRAAGAAQVPRNRKEAKESLEQLQ
jgi:hypothetical protein